MAEARPGRPAVVVLALVVPVLAVLMSPPATAQAPGPAAAAGDVLTIRQVSPWVAADGVFRVEFAPSAPLPPGSVLRYTIGQRLRPEDSRPLRDTAAAALGPGFGFRTLQGPRRVDVAELGDAAGGLVLEVPIRSRSSGDSRQFIPTAGVHPVDIDLLGPAGDTLWEEQVFLNRLPVAPPTGRDGAPATTSVQLLAGLDSPPALSSDGTTDLDTQERALLSPVLSLLSESTEVPLTVALRPNTLLALQRSEDPAERQVVEGVEGSAWSVAAQSYVRVDAGSLVATGTDELTRQLEVGENILRAVAGRETTGIWLLDDTVDTEAARVLREAGISHVLASEDRIAVADDDLRPLLRSRTIALEGVEAMAVSTYDADITRLLVEPEIEAGLRSHRAHTALMSEWFDALADDAVAFPGVSAAVVLPPGIEQEVVSGFAAPLRAEGPLRLAAPPAPTSTDRDPRPTAALRDLEPSDLSGVVDRTRAVQRRIDGYGSMTGGADPETADWTLANDQGPALVATRETRTALWTGIDAAIDDRLALIDTPPDRTVVLTSRTGSIPLRFNNGLDTEVRLLMTTRSPRLEFPEGSTQGIVLAPGENRIDLPVEVQAPGSALLRIELRSPDGALALPDTTVTVRSSSISGVGAALSALSLAVLAVWWIRTHRGRSRGAEADTPTAEDPHGAPDGTVGDDGHGEEGTHG